jgi:hypothetical protein
MCRLFYFKRPGIFFRRKHGQYASGQEFREPLALSSIVWLGGAERFRRMVLLSDMPMRSLRGLLPMRFDLKECSYARYLGLRPPLFSLSKIKIVSRREREARVREEAELALRPRKPLKGRFSRKSHVSKRTSAFWFGPLK